MGVAGVTKSMPMAVGVEKLAANPATKGFMSTIGKGIGKVFSMIKSAGTWLAEKLGIKWVGGVMNKAENWLAENLLKPIGNAVGLKGIGNKVLSKSAGSPTVGQATRTSIVQTAKTKGVVNPTVQTVADKGSELYDKARQSLGKIKKPAAVPSTNNYGLSNDVSDQLDLALG
jgi:hypothetical protein